MFKGLLNLSVFGYWLFDSDSLISFHLYLLFEYSTTDLFSLRQGFVIFMNRIFRISSFIEGFK